MSDISRRQMVGGIVAGGLAATSILKAAPAAAAEATKTMRQFKNEDFYVDGKFNVDAAKKAYFEMMEYFNYPIPPRLRTDDFWTLDFNLGNFMEVGMAGIFWVNCKEWNYFGHEIYLLPGQMIPEHKHVKTPDAGPKMEAWHVRHGSIHIYGEGTPTPGVDERIPASHRQCANARLEKALGPGEMGALNAPEAWHWMRAGAEGAIVTEYATYHDGKALRFSHPKVSL